MSEITESIQKNTAAGICCLSVDDAEAFELLGILNYHRSQCTAYLETSDHAESLHGSRYKDNCPFKRGRRNFRN